MATGTVQLRLHQIEALDDVVDPSRLGLDPREAVRGSERSGREPPPFPPLVQLLGSVLATMGLAVLLGSSGRGMVIAGTAGGDHRGAAAARVSGCRCATRPWSP